MVGHYHRRRHFLHSLMMISLSLSLSLSLSWSRKKCPANLFSSSIFDWSISLPFYCSFLCCCCCCHYCLEPFRLMLCWRSFYGHRSSSCFDCSTVENLFCRRFICRPFRLQLSWSFTFFLFAAFQLFPMWMFNLGDCLLLLLLLLLLLVFFSNFCFLLCSFCCRCCSCSLIRVSRFFACLFW